MSRHQLKPVKTSSVKTSRASSRYVIHVFGSSLSKQEMADYCPQFLRQANLIAEISTSFFPLCLTVDLQMCRQADGAHHLRSDCVCALNVSVEEPFFSPTRVGLFPVTPSVLRILASEMQPVM